MANLCFHPFLSVFEGTLTHTGNGACLFMAEDVNCGRLKVFVAHSELQLIIVHPAQIHYIYIQYIYIIEMLY